MAYGKHKFTLSLLLAFAGLFAFAASVLAAPDYKTLKEDIRKLEQAVSAAQKERNDADAKLADNSKAQQKAAGDQLAALKKDAIKLSDAAHKKASALAIAQQNLASKQGELRETAAAHAVKQLTEQGAIENRVGEAANAVDDWKAALGTLPAVPALRSLEGMVDPEERASIRASDKKSLEAFEKWAASEETRVDKELKQAREVVDGEAKWNASKDGGPELVTAARSLKETLEARKKKLGELRKSAKDLIATIK